MLCKRSLAMADLSSAESNGILIPTILVSFSVGLVSGEMLPLDKTIFILVKNEILMLCSRIFV